MELSMPNLFRKHKNIQNQFKHLLFHISRKLGKSGNGDCGKGFRIETTKTKMDFCGVEKSIVINDGFEKRRINSLESQ